MKAFGSRSLPAISAIIVLVLQISPVLAGGAPDPQDTVTPSARVSDLPGPAIANGAHKHRRAVEVSFTKWITAFPLMEGGVGHTGEGVFAGEVLNAKPTTNRGITSITSLEAVYEVQAGRHSFTALLRGGQNNVTRTAVLDGVILNGWRTGARVHVEFDIISTCDGKPAGPCFQGTIRILPDSHD